MLLLRLLFAAALCGGPAALRAQTPVGPTHIVSVVIKLDDVRTNDSGHLSARWRRVADFAIERKIKVSLGVIADSLENPKPEYTTWLRSLQNSGLVELWFHGYDHGVRPLGDKQAPEFAGRSYEEQKALFDKSQTLALAAFGAPFRTYGPPGGGNVGPSAEDLQATARVLSEDAAMKVWMYPKPHDELSRSLTAAGKVVVLDRVWQVNLEQPLFVPNAAKFIEGYAKHAAGRRYFILQGHANKWDDARWAEFVKIIDYLQANQIPTVLPSELAATLAAPASAP